MIWSKILVTLAQKQLHHSAQTYQGVLELVDESRLRLNETNILEIPELALKELLKYLSLRDILNLRIVNSRLYTEVTKLHKRCNVWILTKEKISAKPPDQIFFQSNTRIHLKLKDITPDMIEVLATGNCAERIIRLSGTSYDDESPGNIPANVIHKITRLEELLWISGSQSSDAMVNLQILLNSNPNTLRKMELISINPGNSLRINHDMTKLQSLKLYNFRGPNQFILNLLSKCRSTSKFLTLKSDGLWDILHGCSVDFEMTNLQKVSISYSALRLDNQGMQKLLTSSPNLEFLLLKNVVISSEEGCQIKLYGLKTLNVATDKLNNCSSRHSRIL